MLGIVSSLGFAILASKQQSMLLRNLRLGVIRHLFHRRLLLRGLGCFAYADSPKR